MTKDELLQLLREYGRHNEGCSAAFGDTYRCRCGWRDVERALATDQEGEPPPMPDHVPASFPEALEVLRRYRRRLEAQDQAIQELKVLLLQQEVAIREGDARLEALRTLLDDLKPSLRDDLKPSTAVEEPPTEG